MESVACCDLGSELPLKVEYDNSYSANVSDERLVLFLESVSSSLGFASI